MKYLFLVPTCLSLCVSLSAEEKPAPPPPPVTDPTVTVPPPPPVPKVDNPESEPAPGVQPATTTPTTGAPRRNRAAALAGRGGVTAAKPLTIRLNLNAGYDSNVLREDSTTPSPTNTSGSAISGELNGTYRAIRSPSAQLNIIGDMRYNAYTEESRANIGRAGMAAFGLLRFGVIDPGMVLGVNRQWIDGEGLATIARGTVLLSRLHPEREHFDSVSFDFYNIDYDNNEPASGIMTDVLWRHWWMPEAGNAYRRFEFSLTAGMYDADTKSESFVMFKPSISSIYRLGEQDTTLGLWDLSGILSYEWRKYDVSFAGQLEEEQDLFQFGLGADRWFGGNMFSAGPFLNYTMRTSNLVGNDYDRVQVGLHLRADW